MRKILTAILLMAVALAGFSQTRRFEHALSAGAGFFIDHRTHNGGSGLALRAAYSVDYYLSPAWSLGSGIVYRQLSETPFNSKDGADEDTFSFVDIPLVVRYHFGTGREWSVGIGPALSLCTANDGYYVDADPRSPLNGLDKIKRAGLGLQPSVFYTHRHLRLGVEGNFGLLDVKNNHGLTSGKQHLHDISAVIGFRF